MVILISRAFSLLALGLGVPLLCGAATTDLDFDGDGRSDYVITRRTDPDSTSPARIAWHVLLSGSGEALVVEHGLAETDFITPADFDGDGRTDFAVWRTGPPEEAAFYIRESSTGEVRREQFGQAGDDPLVVADYDGDGRADPAVFRCPPQPGQCLFFYRGSARNPRGDTTYMPWGFGTADDLFPVSGDFDGDRRHDFCVQGVDPGRAKNSHFVALLSADSGQKTTAWGLATDRVVSGDFNGDGRADFVVVRRQAGRLMWLVRLSDDSGVFEKTWGLEGDVLTPADYDGDGITDLAVWREEPGEPSTFLVEESSSGQRVVMVWGRSGDYPPAEAPVR
jgi:hypothetical protein